MEWFISTFLIDFLKWDLNLDSNLKCYKEDAKKGEIGYNFKLKSFHKFKGLKWWPSCSFFESNVTKRNSLFISFQNKQGTAGC